jgi:hypothetical protein
MKTDDYTYEYKSTFQKNTGSFTILNEGKVSNSIPIFMKITVLFFNILSFIGLAFTISGISFLVLFTTLSGESSVNVPSDSPVIQGKIESVEATNSYINDIQVYKFYYSYDAPDGNKYSGFSYGRSRNEQVGDMVSISYNSEVPSESQILGMENDSFPKFIYLFLLIFPIVGIALLYFGLKKGIRNVKIIQYGKVSSGSFNRKEPTNASVNKQNVYKFYFDFKADDGNSYTATGETHLTYLLEDEYREPVIYNSANPSEAVLTDTLPKSVRRFFTTEIENELSKYKNQK